MWLLINISPSNVIQKMLLYVKYFQISGHSECEWVLSDYSVTAEMYITYVVCICGHSVDKLSFCNVNKDINNQSC